jgi:hypothetical protein
LPDLGNKSTGHSVMSEFWMYLEVKQTYTRKSTFVYVKFKFNEAYCILHGNSTCFLYFWTQIAFPHKIHFLMNMLYTNEVFHRECSVDS